MTTTADQLAAVRLEMDHHWHALRLHEDCIRQLQAQERVLREAVDREEAAELRQAKRFCGPGTRRSG